MFLTGVFTIVQSFLFILSIIFSLISLKVVLARPSIMIILAFHAPLAYPTNSELLPMILSKSQQWLSIKYLD